LQDQITVDELQMQTPQLRQCEALLNIENFVLEIKQFGCSENGSILGGALAIADSLASLSVVNEKAFKYFEAVAGFLETPFWFVLMVAIHKFVAVLW